MTWGIWQIFTRALESLKIGILMGSFNPKLKKYELKIHRAIICHDNEELRKIWTGTDLPCQSWHEEFDKFWPEHLKVSKIFTLIGSFWAKCTLFELKKFRGVIFHETEEGYKIWKGTDLLFPKLTYRIWQILTRALESLKDFHFNGLLLRKVYIVWTKKLDRIYLSWHWRIMKNLKKNWLVAWKMTWGIWQIFTRALKSVKIGTLMGSFCPK